MRFHLPFKLILYNEVGDDMIMKNMNEIKDILSSDFSVVLAKSHGCGVCDITKAQLLPILKEYGVNLTEVYIDDTPEFRGEHLVFTVPTVLVFSNQKEMLRESRFIDLNKIKRILKLNFE